MKVSIANYRDLIYTAIARVPHGRVASYGQIAQMIGLPNHARLVGAALKDLPEHSRVPWFRIVNAQGKIAFPLGSARFVEQVRCLQQEGVEVVCGKIALNLYGLNG